MRLPSLSATMMGLPSTTTATALLVVPRSMPHIDAARVVTLMGARRPRARGRPEVCSPRRDGERSGSWRPCERRRRAERREDDGRGLDEDATVEALASIAREGPIAVRNSEAAAAPKSEMLTRKELSLCSAVPPRTQIHSPTCSLPTCRQPWTTRSPSSAR